MAKGRKGFFDRAEQRGSELDKTGIDGKPVHKSLEDGTKRRYNDAMNIWADYCTKNQKDPVKDAYDLKTLKHFTKGIVWGLDGCEGEDDLPSAKSARQVWKDFTAKFRRQNDPIPRNTTLSVTNWVKEQIKKRGLPASKRPRRYASDNHLVHLGTQLWERDWFEYKRPGIRVSTWSETLDYGFTSARVGEYLESTARANSGRGLYHRDIIFIVFRNEHGQPEFAAQLTRDAKGMTWTPDKRPEQAIHEGSEPRPFLLNPILPKLAMCLARGAFRDYKTIDDVFNIPAPPEKEVYQLFWEPSICNSPFYEGATTEIEKANSYSTRLNDLGRRADYVKPPTIHDFRAEGLHLIDSLYSTAQRMGHGGQWDERTHRQHYQPNNPGTDGQDAYLRGKIRTIVADLFRGMTVARNPNLFHCLPAEKKAELEASPEFTSMDNELKLLKTQPPSKDRDRRRREIYRDRQKMRKKGLRQAQKAQPCERPWEASAEIRSIGGYRSRFQRIRHLMPERNRLAKSMFEVGCLRSSAGRQVLQDMIALYKQEKEVTVRPGLEPDKCHCHPTELSAEPAKSVTSKKPGPHKGFRRWPSKAGLEVALSSTPNSTTPSWKHIYTCHKQYLSETNGFAELCSLCNRWIVGLDAWEQHCQSHLVAPQTIPIQCDPLIYGGTLGAFGYCPICLGNTELLARDRMQQFTRPDYWMSHVTKCTEELDRRSTAGCSIPWCDIPCENALSRRYHLQDVHCAQFNKGLKRSAQDVTAEDVDEIPSCKRGRKTLNNKLTAGPVDSSISTEKYQFIDETPETTKPPNSTAVHPRAIGKLRKKQSSAKQPNSLVPTVVSPPPLATCPTDVKAGIALPMMLNKVFSEVVATPVESALIKPVRPVPSSPTLPHSKDTEVTRDSSEEFDTVTLRTLTSPKIESWTPHSDLCTGMAQEFSGDPSLETRSAISLWLDRRARNLPPIGANRDDDRTVGDALALTGDGDKSADLDCDLFPSRCTTPHDAIGSLEPDDVDIDAIFNQYLCSPSPSPPPTSSPDGMTSELSGATLCDARRDPSRSYSELYTRTSKSPAPEMSPESEIARDRDDPCHSANRAGINPRVGQPKITLRLRLQGRCQPRKKKGKGRSGKEGPIQGLREKGGKGRGGRPVRSAGKRDVHGE
ncbi:hypothetical protein HRR83_004084 [Exophiala dermatitidis]|uniref:Uncharacterized protein n=1 Tax=Exophiala dermatitidis TaxID=5970 RepID=A0AAN6EU76_EXODE|nr:hypothetical protein HRR73_007727 [Exophiala dermatitidis]KAJ4517925.1 hypothetical protein HRR75_003146 [Exophiala dermatitidis]KAJ4521611.1 hypothetical protein HRR74_003436 [Exophiala dermatitidis]KAJ4533305.1 hypothetical protein HRR77_008655 [Exophiala dermatitidis]KAJ4545058.1 hypothetical protein HRR76_003088 [Exophiala dermatitidis]